MQILKSEGFMSMMKGAGANILRGVAGAGVLSGADEVKAMYIKMKNGQYFFLIWNNGKPINEIILNFFSPVSVPLC